MEDFKTCKVCGSADYVLIEDFYIVDDKLGKLNAVYCDNCGIIRVNKQEKW